MTWWNKVARSLRSEAPLSMLEVGKRAPQFSLKALDGKQYSLDSLLARGPVVAAFFKISCPVCQFTFPFLQRLSERFAGQNISIIGISQDDSRNTKEFNREYGVTFPTLIDDNGYSASNAYGLTNVPTIFLIDSNGVIKVSSSGFDKAALEQIARELTQQQKIAASPLFRPDEVVPAYKPG
jgi:peroxiredoxin